MAVTTESYAGKIQRKLLKKQKVIEAASGRKKADLVLKNATFVNVFSNELTTCDIACANGLIVGLGEYDGEVEYDMTGKIVCPGFIDAHIHLGSSLVSPREFVRATLPHGTTTVITDPHEITNVMGTDGIDYMFQATEGLPIDVRFMLPSCVPATPMDESGANLDYRAIDSFYDYPRVQGLAEMMNAYGVIHNDKEVVSKIVAAQAHHKKIDGHAPGLLGKDLDTYIAAIIYVFTAYIHVPSHTGYTHVGDGFLYLAASLLPAPYAAAAGAIGAGLADLLSVYSIWAPGTIIIKALTAFCFTNKLDKLVNKRNVLGIVLALVLCVGGYYLYEAIITGNFAAPALGIPGYLTQVALSSVVYLALGAALDRAGLKKKLGEI